MKIIYIYKKNIYAAFVAAYLHLNINISEIKFPSQLEIMRLNFMGLDENLNEIYILNYGYNKNICENIIHSLAKLYQEDVKIIDLSKFDKMIFLFSKRRTLKYIKENK